MTLRNDISTFVAPWGHVALTTKRVVSYERSHGMLSRYQDEQLTDVYMHLEEAHDVLSKVLQEGADERIEGLLEKVKGIVGEVTSIQQG